MACTTLRRTRDIIRGVQQRAVPRAISENLVECAVVQSYVQDKHIHIEYKLNALPFWHQRYCDQGYKQQQVSRLTIDLPALLEPI